MSKESNLTSSELPRIIWRAYRTDGTLAAGPFGGAKKAELQCGSILESGHSSDFKFR